MKERYKLALLSASVKSGGASLSQVFAVAMGRIKYLLASGSSTDEALARLKKHLRNEPHSEIFLNFSCEESFSGICFEGKNCLVISESSAPIEWAEAKKIVGPYLCDPEKLALWNRPPPRKKILLHVCCGPDAAGVIGQLKEDFEVLSFWYDPNIQPRAEYLKRLDAFKEVSKLLETPYIEGEYDVDNFFTQIQGLEASPEQGAKCSVCYDMRLERSAVEAKKQGCDYFTTTLAISPHKVQEKLKNFGELSGNRHGIAYLAKNFMKHEAFKESVQFTEENRIYRQDYCGCYFSLHEGGAQAQQMAQDLGFHLENIKKREFQIPIEGTP